MKVFFSAILFLFAFLLVIPIVFFIRASGDVQLWINTLSNVRLFKSIGMTILVASLSLIINIVVGTPAAQILSRKDFPGKQVVLGLIMLPFVIPSFVTSMGLHFSFIKLGLVETVIGVTLIHSIHTLPYYMRTVMAGFQTLSEDYELLGYAYGASRIKTFLYIAVPHILPSILVASSLVFTVSFSQYLNTFIIGGGKIETMPIIIFPHLSSGNIGTGSVYSFIFILVNLALILFTEILATRISRKKLGRPVYDRT
ncbi:MAG: ABC transporter permease [Brevinema sp.]